MDLFWTVKCNHSQRTTWPVRLRIFDCWSLKILAPLSSKPALFQSSWTAVDWGGYLFYKSGLFAIQRECWMFITQGEDYALWSLQMLLTSFFFFYGFKVETNFVFSLHLKWWVKTSFFATKILELIYYKHWMLSVFTWCLWKKRKLLLGWDSNPRPPAF